MPRNCKACNHRKREEIDRALIKGDSFRDVAGRYRVSKSALQRHKEDHLQVAVRQAIQQDTEHTIITAQEVWELVTLLCMYDPLDWHNEFGAFRDMKDIPWSARMAIQSAKRRDIYNQEDKADKDGERSIIGETREIKAYSRLEALKLAAQLHQMLKPAEVQNNEFNLFLTKSKDELEYFIKNGCWPSETADITATVIPAG